MYGLFSLQACEGHAPEASDMRNLGCHECHVVAWGLRAHVKTAMRMSAQLLPELCDLGQPAHLPGVVTVTHKAPQDGKRQNCLGHMLGTVPGTQQVSTES